jgi:hypothetical protein
MYPVRAAWGHLLFLVRGAGGGLGVDLLEGHEERLQELLGR